MATEDYWADSPLERGGRLFSVYFPILDSLIHPDDPVRLVDEILDEVDWSLWEAEYPRYKGQPPIHPKHLAADEARRRQGGIPEKNPAQVPTTDPDSRVMPNKEGGYAPNYTSVATTDGERGLHRGLRRAVGSH